MDLRISTDPGTSVAQRTPAEVANRAEKDLGRRGSGIRIHGAAEDATGLALSESLQRRLGNSKRAAGGGSARSLSSSGTAAGAAQAGLGGPEPGGDVETSLSYLSKISDAIQTVVRQLASMQSMEIPPDPADRPREISIENSQDANSGIREVSVAAETTALAADLVLQEMASAALAQAHVSRELAISLLS